VIERREDKPCLRPRQCANVGAFETRAESERAETRLAEKLRRRGFAGWSN